MFTTTLLSSLVLTACSFKENLPEKDISGKVVIPAAALTRDVVSATDPDGDGVFDTLTSQVGVTDTRLIGPIYLGAFAGIDDVSFDYPHPRMGPVVDAGIAGNTFPYGGATVGRMDFACYESIKCKMTTGRFESYDEILDYFQNILGSPVIDPTGAKVEYSSTFQQYCFDYFYYTSDDEMSFLGPEDFVENADGDFEASFNMAHTILEEGQELNLWGWMDAPQISIENPDINGSFSTCDTSGVGRTHEEYDQSYTEGRVFSDLLNKPNSYITEGDWIADGSTIIHWDAEAGVVQPDDLVVRLDIPHTSEEE